MSAFLRFPWSCNVENVSLPGFASCPCSVGDRRCETRPCDAGIGVLRRVGRQLFLSVIDAVLGTLEAARERRPVFSDRSGTYACPLHIAKNGA